MLLPLIAPLLVMRRRKTDPLFSVVLILSGAFGFAWLIAQGFGIGIRGFNFDWLTALFGELGDRQFGMGYGALVVASSFLFLLTQGIAARGAINGDVFVVSAIGGVIVIVGTFVFFPIAKMLIFAFITEDGGYSANVFVAKFFDDRIWGLGCLSGARCGVAWNSFFLAICVGDRHHRAGAGLRPGRDPLGLSLQARGARAHRAADHHPALRDRAGADPAVRPVRHRHPDRVRLVRHPADALALRPARAS